MECILVLIVPLCSILPWENPHSCNIMPHLYYFIFVTLFISLKILKQIHFQNQTDVYNVLHFQQGGLPWCYDKAKYREIKQRNNNSRVFGNIDERHTQFVEGNVYSTILWPTEEVLQWIKICADFKTAWGEAESRSTSRVWVKTKTDGGKERVRTSRSASLGQY